MQQVNILDLIQTACAVLSLLISLFVASKVVKINNHFSSNNKRENKMSIKNGDGNIQSTGDVKYDRR